MTRCYACSPRLPSPDELTAIRGYLRTVFRSDALSGAEIRIKEALVEGAWNIEARLADKTFFCVIVDKHLCREPACAEVV